MAASGTTCPRSVSGEEGRSWQIYQWHMNYTIKEKSDPGETNCMKLSTKTELEETPQWSCEKPSGELTFMTFITFGLGGHSQAWRVWGKITVLNSLFYFMVLVNCAEYYKLCQSQKKALNSPMTSKTASNMPALMHRNNWEWITGDIWLIVVWQQKRIGNPEGKNRFLAIRHFHVLAVVWSTF